jgi:hypothetical protein
VLPPAKKKKYKERAFKVVLVLSPEMTHFQPIENVLKERKSIQGGRNSICKGM